MIKYNEEEARKTDRAYSTPDVVRQRMRTLEVLKLQTGETVLDVGCGSGLLTQDMATLVGEQGRVVGIDNSQDMLFLAEQRCSEFSQVNLKLCGIDSISEKTGDFDAVTCIQVLLYVPDVSAALSEMYRVLKPGGRIAIMETDWRGTVLNSSDESLTRKMLTSWDDAVSSPNLPVRLAPLMKSQGFSATSVDAFPIVNTSYTRGSWSIGMLKQFAGHAQKQGAVSTAESETWLNDIQSKGEKGCYFFCVNRFIFTAVKV
jgi:ubiquinone/menaquinone biosynthesis C-methylase UbiE